MILDLFAESRAAVGSSAKTAFEFIMTARAKTALAFPHRNIQAIFAQYKPNAQRVHHLAESSRMPLAWRPCLEQVQLDVVRDAQGADEP